MAQQFIKVTKTYSCKNKAQKLILTHLGQLDRCLYKDITEAKKEIETAYNTAIEQYTGHAKVTPITMFKFDKTTTQYSVEDVILLSVYMVKN